MHCGRRSWSSRCAAGQTSTGVPLQNVLAGGRLGGAPGPRPRDPSKSDDVASLADLQYDQGQCEQVSGRCQRRGTSPVSVVAGVCPMPRQVVDGYVQMPEPERLGNGAGAEHRYDVLPASGLDLRDASRQLIRPDKPHPVPFARCCCRQSQRPRCGPSMRRFT